MRYMTHQNYTYVSTQTMRNAFPVVVDAQEASQPASAMHSKKDSSVGMKGQQRSQLHTKAASRTRK